MLYDEKIESHNEMPNNKFILDNFKVKFKDNNPVCGDVVEIYLDINEEIIKNASFQGSGCMISMASSDILLDFVKDKNIHDLLKLTDDNIVDMIGIELGVNRIKCATLPLKALKRAILEYISKNE
jgi:nitrogen fixation NifU-like protein